jgi:phage-related tail fiber protein
VALHSYTGTDLNNNTLDDAGFVAAVRFVADEALAAGVPDVILRVRGRFSGGGAWRTDGAGVNGFSADMTMADAIKFVQAVGRPRVKLGLSLSNLLAADETAETISHHLSVASAATPAVQLGMVFFAAAENNPFADPRTNNVFQTLNARVSDASASHREELVGMLRALVRVAGVPVMMDAVLETSDQEYLEAIALRAALSRS